MFGRWTFLSLGGLVVCLGLPERAYPEANVIQAINRVADDLVDAMPPHQNCLVSPAGVATVLAITRVGAVGPTRRQLSECLHLAEDSPIDQEILAGLLASSKSQPQHGMMIRNAMWLQSGYTLHPMFRELVGLSFRCPVSSIDFRDSPTVARSAIGRSISTDSQDHEIPLLEQGALSPDTRLVVLNSTRFKASWQRPMQPIEDFTWHGLSADRSVEAMTCTGQFAYFQRPGYQAVAVPLRDTSFTMLFMLSSSEAVTSDGDTPISPADMASGHAEWPSRRTVVVLPRFEVSAAWSMRDSLADQIPLAFSEEADFSAISPEGDLKLHDAIQSCRIQVDQHGVEASAATVAMVGVKRAPEANFIADRPFRFLLVDRESGLIWFAGRIVEPSLSK